MGVVLQRELVACAGKFRGCPKLLLSLSSLGQRWGHQRNLVALGQESLKSHSSVQVLEMKQPNPFSRLRGEGEDGWEEQTGRACRTQRWSRQLSIWQDFRGPKADSTPNIFPSTCIQTMVCFLSTCWVFRIVLSLCCRLSSSVITPQGEVLPL